MELTKTITDIKFIKRTIIVLIGTFILALSARLQTHWLCSCKPCKLLLFAFGNYAGL